MATQQDVIANNQAAASHWRSPPQGSVDEAIAAAEHALQLCTDACRLAADRRRLAADLCGQGLDVPPLLLLLAPPRTDNLPPEENLVGWWESRRRVEELQAREATTLAHWRDRIKWLKSAQRKEIRWAATETE